MRATLLAYLTEPKPSVVFDAPRPALSRAAFARAATTRGVELDLRTRLLYAQREVAINGDAVDTAGLDAAQRRALRRLADCHSLAPASVRGEVLLALFYAWYGYGWVRLAINGGWEP